MKKIGKLTLVIFGSRKAFKRSCWKGKIIWPSKKIEGKTLAEGVSIAVKVPRSFRSI